MRGRLLDDPGVAPQVGPAVDVPGLARDEPRGVAGQVRNELRDLLGRPRPLHRRALGEVHIRIAHLAFKQAQQRRKKLTLVDKANVLETSRLWRKVVQDIARQYADVKVDFLFVDNAAGAKLF